jgi:phage terminase large subunit
VDEGYKNKLEGLKNKNKNLYDIYALGNWGVLGETVYSNYKIEKIKYWIEGVYEPKEYEPDIIFHQSEVYVGQDFGFNEPSATCMIGFKDDEIFILRELYVRGLDNPELMVEVEKFGARPFRVVADSAEPARLKSWRKDNWRVVGAKKEKDSVTHGIGWIRSHFMHINSECVNFISEVQSYVYEKDKDGIVQETPVDFNNHLMDAMRYGLEPVIRGRPIEFLK